LVIGSVQTTATAAVANAMSPDASPAPPSRRSTIASQAALRAAVVSVTAIAISFQFVVNGFSLLDRLNGPAESEGALEVAVLVADLSNTRDNWCRETYFM
jgi:hypothetical protein